MEVMWFPLETSVRSTRSTGHLLELDLLLVLGIQWENIVQFAQVRIQQVVQADENGTICSGMDETSR